MPLFSCFAVAFLAAAPLFGVSAVTDAKNDRNENDADETVDDRNENGADASVDADKNLDYYSSFDEFNKALQNRGSIDQKSKQKLLKHKELSKLCTKCYRQLLKYKEKEIKLQNLDAKNISRGARSLFTIIMDYRKQQDKAMLHTEFHEFAKEGESQMYVIANDVKNFGCNIILRDLFAMLESKAKTKQEN